MNAITQDVSYSFYTYALPLIHTEKKREGVLICLNETCWGEVAPLPGFSKETLSEAYRQLQEVLPCLLRNPALLNDLPLFPSVAWGIESALYHLTYPSQELSVPLSALLMGTYEDILTKAQQSEKEGYKSAKLKISNLTKQEAFDLIHLLKKRFSLRIDCNRTFDLQEALEFFSSFENKNFDYIEEPLKNPHELHLFSHNLALDESLSDLTFEEIGLIPHVKALIIKPTFLGGLTTCQKYSAFAKIKKIPLVLSSAFESGVGITHLARLSHNLNSAEVPLGLDTYRFLKQDILQTPLNFSKSVLSFSTQAPLNLKLLTKGLL